MAIKLLVISGQDNVAGLYASVGIYYDFLVCAILCSYIENIQGLVELYVLLHNENDLISHDLGHQFLFPKLIVSKMFAIALLG